MLYLVSIMCTKIAILMLYIQVFGIKKRFRYLCFSMMAVVVFYCTIFFFIEAFNCNPVEKVWHSLTYTGKFTCFDNTHIERVIGGFNIATDFIILVLPIPLILRLQLDPRRKLGLAIIFGTGVFIFASTVTREVIVVRTLRDFDQTWVTVPEIIWYTVENDIGIICVCLPILGPLKKTKFFEKVNQSSIQYILSKTGFAKSEDSNGSRSTGSSKRMGYHRSESGIELVDGINGGGKIRKTTDVEITSSMGKDASDNV
ncbi:MAG: hypothetical protein Q9225_003272 [Loekoesia sp. 1 TL-2023]